jgi:prepilin-type N-terminal cleavage/methylation domain-containing protein
MAAVSHRRVFTLVELLAVMLIISILLGLSVGMYTTMGRGALVDSGARALASQLHLARSYAVTKREYVALLLPAEGNSGVGEEYRAASLRTCVVDDAGAFQSHIQNTKWIFLPNSVYITNVQNHSTVTGVQFPNTGDGAVDVRAIVFRPNGSLLSGPPSVTFDVARMVRDGTSLTQLDSDNQVSATVNWLTGRTEF